MGCPTCCIGSIAKEASGSQPASDLTVPRLLPILCPPRSLLLLESASVVARPCLASARSRSRAL